MRRTILSMLVVCSLYSLAFSKYAHAASCPAKQHPVFKVEVAPELASEPLSGRLIVMMSTQATGDKLVPSYGPEAHSVWIAAKEVHALTPQDPVELDPNELAYPEKFCTAPEGSYKIQAVLDVNHDFAYQDDVSAGDLVSKLVDQSFHPASDQIISLTLVDGKAGAAGTAPCPPEFMISCSPQLSSFWGTPDSHARSDFAAAWLQQ